MQFKKKIIAEFKSLDFANEKKEASREKEAVEEKSILK